MNRHSCISLIMVAGLVFGGMGVVRAEEGTDQLLRDAKKAIAAAEVAVEQARVAIEKGKHQVVQIPSDSELSDEVNQMLVAALESWSVTISALNGAKDSAAKIGTASSEKLAQDYALLSTVNSGVALSGAKVVQTGLLFIDAAASNKTEALDVIRMAMQDSLAAASQVQFNYERVKTHIAKKYSK